MDAYGITSNGFMMEAVKWSFFMPEGEKMFVFLLVLTNLYKLKYEKSSWNIHYLFLSLLTWTYQDETWYNEPRLAQTHDTQV
jgi:hypothetical protein